MNFNHLTKEIFFSHISLESKPRKRKEERRELIGQPLGHGNGAAERRCKAGGGSSECSSLVVVQLKDERGRNRVAEFSNGYTFYLQLEID